MRKVIDFVKDNKKIIIAIILIVVLAVAVFCMNGGYKRNSAVSTGVQKTSTEIKLSGILSSIDGVGATDVMITEDGDGIRGVIIVCEGANNIMTKNNILNAVSTALKIDKKNIVIYSMNI